MTKNVKTALIVALCLAGVGIAFCCAGRAMGGGMTRFRWLGVPSPGSIQIGSSGITIGGKNGVKINENGVSVGGPAGVNIDDSGVTIGNTSSGAEDESGADSRYFREYQTLDGAYSADGSYAVDASAVESIDLKWYAGKAEIRTGEDGKITFSESAPSKLGEDRALRWDVKDKTLYIQYCAQGAGRRLPEKELTLTVPASLAAKLQGLSFDSFSGDLTVSGLRVKKLALSSDSGDLDAAVSADSAELSTVSGELKLTGSCSALEAHSISGSTTVTGDCKTIKVSSTSGSLRAELTACPTRLAFSTVSGDTELTIPQNSGFTLDDSSVSGDVDCDFPMMYRDEKYVCGNGDAALKITSVSGDVTIRKK